jgi:hypothetical protein
MLRSLRSKTLWTGWNSVRSVDGGGEHRELSVVSASKSNADDHHPTALRLSRLNICLALVISRRSGGFCCGLVYGFQRQPLAVRSV